MSLAGAVVLFEFAGAGCAPDGCHELASRVCACERLAKDVCAEARQNAAEADADDTGVRHSDCAAENEVFQCSDIGAWDPLDE